MKITVYTVRRKSVVYVGATRLTRTVYEAENGLSYIEYQKRKWPVKKNGLREWHLAFDQLSKQRK